jgi:hypothetical protein
MVKLQRQKAYTYKSNSGKEIEHYKYLVNIPENALSELGWNDGQELSFRITNKSLVLEPSKSNNVQTRKR